MENLQFIDSMLKNKKILITGGSRGLGRALCIACRKQGAEIAFTYSADEEGANKTIELCGGAKSYKVSVLDAVGTADMVADIEKEWGGIDILINNSGISQNLPIALTDEEDWDAVMDTNIKGMFITSKAILRTMIRQKNGVILNMSSLAGSRMIEAPAHYCTSKAAVNGFTQSLAKEVARYNIRVLALAPGLLNDGIGSNLPDYRVEDYLKHCSLGRMGTVDEVAEFATFLISDSNSYMSGNVIVMDGGVL